MNLRNLAENQCGKGGLLLSLAEKRAVETAENLPIGGGYHSFVMRGSPVQIGPTAPTSQTILRKFADLLLNPHLAGCV